MVTDQYYVELRRTSAVGNSPAEQLWSETGPVDMMARGLRDAAARWRLTAADGERYKAIVRGPDETHDASGPYASVAAWMLAMANHHTPAPRDVQGDTDATPRRPVRPGSKPLAAQRRPGLARLWDRMLYVLWFRWRRRL